VQRKREALRYPLHSQQHKRGDARGGWWDIRREVASHATANRKTPAHIHKSGPRERVRGERRLTLEGGEGQAG